MRARHVRPGKRWLPSTPAENKTHTGRPATGVEPLATMDSRPENIFALMLMDMTQLLLSIERVLGHDVKHATTAVSCGGADAMWSCLLSRVIHRPDHEHVRPSPLVATMRWSRHRSWERAKRRNHTRDAIKTAITLATCQEAVR